MGANLEAKKQNRSHHSKVTAPIGSMGLECLPTLGENWPHPNGNVAKYSLNGSNGSGCVIAMREFSEKKPWLVRSIRGVMFHTESTNIICLV